MNLEHLASILSATYSSSDTASVQQAEASLLELSAASEPFLQGLLELAATKDKSLRISALTNFRNFLIHSLTNVHFPKASRLQLIQGLFTLLTSPLLDYGQKELAAGSIAPLISTDFPETYLSYFESIVSATLQYFNGSAAEIQGGLFITKALLCNFAKNSAISQILDRLMQPVLLIGKNATIQLTQALSHQRADLAEAALNLLLVWTRIIAFVFNSWNNTTEKHVKMLLGYVDLVEIFRNILVLNLSSDQSSQVLIGFDEVQATAILNESKANVLDMLNISFEYFVDSKKLALEKEKKVLSAMVLIGAELPNSPFIDLVELTIQPLIATLISLCNHAAFAELMLLDHVKKFAVQALSLLHKSSCELRFYKLFNPHYRDLIIHGVLPFLALDAEEISQFEENPDEYVAKAEEICEIQEKETIKNEASHLLESLCEFIDGALVFCAKIFLELLSLSWNETQVPHLAQYSTAKILQLSRDTCYDLALIGLCILNYEICSRKDIKSELEVTIEKFFSVPGSLESNLVRARCCLFWRYFSEHIYLFEQAVKFNYFLNFLLNCLESQCTAVSLQASATLNHIMVEDELMFRIEELSHQIVQVYIRLIPHMHNKAFFESLEELVIKYPEHTVTYLNELVAHLAEKVLHEAAQEKTGKNSIILSKAMTVLKSLASSSDINVQNLQGMEQQLEGLLLLLHNPRVVTFEDDLLSLQKSFIFKTQSVSPIAWRVFECLPGVYSKFNGPFYQIFPLINVYLHFGVDTFKTNPQYIQILIDMCRINLFATPKGKESESVNTEGALIYHLMLQLLPESLDPFLEHILSNTLTRYTSAKSNFLKARLLGVVLNAFSYNAIMTMKLLGNSQQTAGMSYLKYVLYEIFANFNVFLHSYDKRVSVFGLCNLITQEELAPEVGEFLGTIFQVIISILSQSKDDNRTDIEMLAQLWRQLDGPDSDDDALARLTQLTKAQFAQNFNNEEGQANLTLALLISPVSKHDEYQFFKHMLNNIRKRNPEALMKLIGPLDADYREKLETIIQSERVQINQLAGENTTVRRKVKVKKH
mmetsp:Transcript_9325/g.17852  ORF Transcript_9325/g.17852 Transcript_9325/m.17852 type:complete len:1052 (-) Transcript_9325:3984-7139(-)